jgi:hypothetical protein
MEEFILIRWPENHHFKELEGFEENCISFESGPFYEKYGDLAYLVNKNWLEKVNNHIDVTKEIIQLFDFNHAIGKTVLNTYEGDDALLLSFTDYSFIVISDYFTISPIVYSKDDYELVELGLITLEEHELAVEEADLRWEQERLLKLVAQEQKTIDDELTLLAKLKKKYEWS